MRWVPLLVLVVWLMPPPAEACSCGRRLLPERIATTDAIFLGKVEQVDAVRLDAMSQHVLARLRTSGTFKGRFEGQSLEVLTPAQRESCGVDFDVGTTYLVFANRDAQGQLQTDWCSGTGEAAIYLAIVAVLAILTLGALALAWMVVRWLRRRWLRSQRPMA